VNDPAVLSGLPAGDDAGIYALDDATCLVQTVDVMTPVVDDARTFGRICAANCLSDVYAMGGVPRSALSVLAFPAETLDGQIMYEMMAGAMELLAEANVALIGGHSIKDEEIKLGFAITGTLDRERAVRRETPEVGDLLVLTKPLGTGTLSFAHQIGRAYGDMDEVQRSMATLNRAAAEAMTAARATACTDVTGFGLFGHLIGMCRHGEVTARVYADRLPALPGALDALAAGVVPGGIERNREYVADDITVTDGVDEAHVHLGFDAQTSGGLLIAIPADRHETLLAELADRGATAATVGRIEATSSGKIVLTPSAEGGVELPGEIVDERPHESAAGDSCCSTASKPGTSCCSSPASGANPAAAGSTAAESLQAFGQLMRSSAGDGAIDARTKELINLALVLHARCQPCVRAHLAKARKMGIGQEEIDEAAWLATAMGGAPVRLFYAEALEAESAQARNPTGGCCC
jgi:selenide,water dikinase